MNLHLKTLELVSEHQTPVTAGVLRKPPLGSIQGPTRAAKPFAQPSKRVVEVVDTPGRGIIHAMSILILS